MNTNAPETRRPTKPLYDRVADLEDEIFGTREEGYRDGLKPQLYSLRRQLTFWGVILGGVIVASGVLNGKGGEALGMILKGLFGQ